MLDNINWTKLILLCLPDLKKETIFNWVVRDLPIRLSKIIIVNWSVLLKDKILNSFLGTISLNLIFLYHRTCLSMIINL